MSNCIKNDLSIRGPIALVDEIRTEILSWRPAFVLPPESKDIQIDLDSDLKTVTCSFETPSDAPWKWFKATIAKYHDQGVRFFLSWIDDDNLYPPNATCDDWVYTRFGEYYTDLISPSIFKPSEGYRGTDGPITLIFNRRTIDGDPVWEELGSSGIITLDKSGNVISIDGVPFYQILGDGDYDPYLPAIDDEGNELAVSQS